MSTASLKATPHQMDALAAKRLREYATRLRQRNERTPGRYGRIGDRLDAAGYSIDQSLYATALDQLKAIETHMDGADAEVGVRQSLVEQESQGDRRDAPTHTTESGSQTRDGWRWLLAKGRIDDRRRPIGERFREIHDKAQDSLRSCLADGTGGGDQNVAATYNHAKFELDGVRLHMRRSAGEETGAALYQLITAVCGRGDTVRALAASQVDETKKDRKADALTIELGLALDMAGVYFGMIRA